MTFLSRYPALVSGLVMGPIVAAGGLLGGGSVPAAVLSLAIVWGYSLFVTLLGRRGDTMAVLAGHPVDERGEHLNLVACSWAFGITAMVGLGGVVVAQATGGAWQPWAFMCVVMGVSYAGSLAVLRLRD